MLQLKDLTLDFSLNQIVVAKDVAPRGKNVTSNMCFSAGMNLLTKGAIIGCQSVMCLDTGDAAFGSLNANFFESHKDYVIKNGRPDIIRAAGVGGVLELPCYYVPNMDIEIGGTTVEPSEFVVKTQSDGLTVTYDANIGLRTLMLYSKVHFNMVDFTVTTSGF